MSNFKRITGNQIPGFYLGRPRSVYLARYEGTTSTSTADFVSVVALPTNLGLVAEAA